MENPNFQFVPADILAQMGNMKPYTILLLKKGPEFNSDNAQKIIQSEHLPHLFKLRAEGKMLLTMPIKENSDITGFGIYDSIDKDELKKITESDPAILKGILTYELLNSAGIKGDTLV